MSTEAVSSSSSDECPPNKRQRLGSDSAGTDQTNGPTQPTIVGDITPILSQFDCCVCLEHISPPILQCRNSHLFCQTCRQKLRTPATCPECREPLPKGDSRCYHLEQIAVILGIPFPCKYSSNGCSSQFYTDREEESRKPLRVSALQLLGV